VFGNDGARGASFVAENLRVGNASGLLQIFEERSELEASGDLPVDDLASNSASPDNQSGIDKRLNRPSDCWSRKVQSLGKRDFIFDAGSSRESSFSNRRLKFLGDLLVKGVAAYAIKIGEEGRGEEDFCLPHESPYK
jgi:hypothetical protein